LSLGNTSEGKLFILRKSHKLRSDWIAKRRTWQYFTNALRPSGFDYREMDYVAKQGKTSSNVNSGRSGTGRMVIPANINHPNLEPMAIGIASTCKVNANIGASPNSSDISEEIAKLNLAVKYGCRYADGSFPRRR
jgi:phosphomethylpyrimidine synthase